MKLIQNKNFRSFDLNCSLHKFKFMTRLWLGWFLLFSCQFFSGCMDFSMGKGGDLDFSRYSSSQKTFFKETDEMDLENQNPSWNLPEDSNPKHEAEVNLHPRSVKDLDEEWVMAQAPQSFTIELIQAEKPYLVAAVMNKAPKNEHIAALKYQNSGKNWYKGLYGSFPSYEAAQTAFETLPEDLKGSARIKSFEAAQRLDD